ncbi:MAG: 2-amino-4-hydroxy-6-hydroxymethyldihydropteridine diphosphokinase [Candidatus Kryptoniota bacterium]
MEVDAYLLLGSNLGDRVASILTAIRMIGELRDTNLLRTSSIYETEPFGFSEQPPFLNIGVIVRTNLSPEFLLHNLKLIEKKIGRKERPKWHEREIDIDIIFYGKSIVQTRSLTIPHPLMHLRRFVLVPLVEIDSDFMHPVYGKNLATLLAECTDQSYARRTEIEVNHIFQ